MDEKILDGGPESLTLSVDPSPSPASFPLL